MTDNIKKNICIFGGTFDPIHNGHIHIINSVFKNDLYQISKSENNYIKIKYDLKIDKLYVMPSYKVSHKKDKTVSDFQKRLDMTNIAINKLCNKDKISVSDFEKYAYLNHFIKDTRTVEILNTLSNIYENNNYIFLMGKDSLYNIDSWEKPDELLKKYTFIVANRCNEIENEISRRIYETSIRYDANKILFMSINNDISSSRIRKIINKYYYSNSITKEMITEMTDEDVLKYILNKEMYKNGY